MAHLVDDTMWYDQYDLNEKNETEMGKKDENEITREREGNRRAGLDFVCLYFIVCFLMMPDDSPVNIECPVFRRTNE